MNSETLTTALGCKVKELNPYRAVFIRVSKSNWFYINLRFMIGLKISRHFLNQWEVKPKPIMTR